MNLQPLIGAAQLAIGQGRGITRFSDTPQAFLASLAPFVALPLVGSIALMLGGAGQDALAALLLTAVAQLAPPVLSHALAKRWGIEDHWLRYATAFNWCQWAIPVAAFVILVILQVDDQEIDTETAARIMLFSLSAYGLWLNWTVARYGLILSRLRAAALVAMVNFGTAVLIMAPKLLQALLS